MNTFTARRNPPHGDTHRYGGLRRAKTANKNDTLDKARLIQPVTGLFIPPYRVEKRDLVAFPLFIQQAFYVTGNDFLHSIYVS